MKYYSDVEDVRNLVQQLKECTDVKSPWTDEALSKVARSGMKNEASYILNRAASAARYRSVDADIERYRKLSVEAGLKIDEKFLLGLQRAEKSDQDAMKSCTNKDLRSQLGPVRDQDSVGYCYAFAAADLYSAKLHETISAWDIDLTYQEKHGAHTWFGGKRKQSDLEGGTVLGALNLAQAKGPCLESAFPSEYAGNAEKNEQLELIIASLEKAAALLKHPNATLSGLSCEDQNNLKQFEQILGLEDLNNLIATSSVKDVILKVNSLACDKNRIAVPKLSGKSQPNQFYVLKTINEQLDADNVSAISYRADILMDRHGVLPPDYPSDTDIRAEFAHASVIVGRHWNPITHDCDYLVRNSWGKGDSKYDDFYQPKENGNIWIPQEDLEGAVDDVTYIP